MVFNYKLDCSLLAVESHLVEALAAATWFSAPSLKVTNNVAGVLVWLVKLVFQKSKPTLSASPRHTL
nr:hypothetical protein [Massilia sp. YIM B04103]